MTIATVLLIGATGSIGRLVAAQAFVKAALDAVRGREVRIALMTAIGVTVHDTGYNRRLGSHDWKRRSERLVRASGHPYTIVRPGWFDYNDADERHLVFLQGDHRRAGNSSDGVIAREDIARVLLAGLHSAAERITLELVAERGAAQEDVEPLFAALDQDPVGVEGAQDPDTLPLSAEPDGVRADLDAVEG